MYHMGAVGQPPGGLSSGLAGALGVGAVLVQDAMKTTLKRGMGRGATVNGGGRVVFPPGVVTPMTRYRQAEPEPRGAWHLIRLIFLWTVLAALVVAGGAAGAAYLRAHRFIAKTEPKSALDKAAAKAADVAIPGQPTTALVIGTDKRLGPQAEETGRSDTLMLVRADPQKDTISLLSFPRDLGVTIRCPGRPQYHDRINAAYSECGSLGSLETVRGLTGLPINYFITVNFRGFMDLVNKLGGVWIDVDRRYLCNSQTCPDVTPIDLQPGYQRLPAGRALAYVRFRHLDSDLYRVARQQLFLKALKQQITNSLSLGTVLDIVDAVEKNVVIGRGGNKPLDLQTIKDYIYFASRLPAGHIFQARIDGLTGQFELFAPESSIATAVQDFVQPDVDAPSKARDVTLGIRRRSKSPRPRDVTTSVLNGNGIAGSAANAAYELGRRGYDIVLPATGAPQNAPRFNYFQTTVYFDRSQARSRPAARRLADLFGDAQVKPLPAGQLTALANGAMATVVVGQNFHGTLAPTPVDKTPKREPPRVTLNGALTRPLLSRASRRLPFRLEVPRLIERTSGLDFESPIRRYWIKKGHQAVRLTFRTGGYEYWGIEETDWNDAPALAEADFVHRYRGREFSFYYSGAHLHMVVLRENGATYWVVNTILDSLSNETMLAIARGLTPLPK
jgi:LCP family protein required for cell wall assembly